jgi:hypothetical protein
MHRDAPLRIDGPAGVICPICALDDITVKAHLTYVVFGGP